MIEASTIRETYAAMNDDEIIEFAEKEGESLTTVAFELLREEFQKRQLDLQPIREIEHKIILRYSLTMQKFEEDFSKDLLKKAWELAFNMKLENASNYKIFTRLQELGIADKYAFYIVNNLPLITTELLEDVRFEIIGAIILILLGAIFIYVTFAVENFYGIAFLVEILGIIKLITCIVRHDKLSRLSTILQDESQDDTPHAV